jgi:hypothetical protein
MGRSWADVGRYTRESGTVLVDGVDDATMFVRLLEAFRTCNIEGTTP